MVGASNDIKSFGYHYLRHLLDFGYRGQIYPVNPHSDDVLGIKAYHTLRETPTPVDLVICCIPAPRVLDLLDECHQQGVKVIQLFTAGFGETGRDHAAMLEREILHRARALGIRLVGPNCMGLYSPGQGISFDYDLPRHAGSVSAIFQSGGGAGEFVRYAALRGIRFSKVLSYGNATDLNESDFLEYFAHDPETRVVAAYIEGIKDGRKFLDALCKLASANKPTVILKGGRSPAGSRSAASHTASLSGSRRIWETAISQAGALEARGLDELIDLVVAFSFLPAGLGRRVGIIGGGGGRSVLAADEAEEEGLEVISLPPAIRKQVKTRAPQLLGWLTNPVDCSILHWSQLTFEDVFGMMTRSRQFDVVIANISLEAPFSEPQWKANIAREIAAAIQASQKKSKPVVAVLRNADLGAGDMGNPRWNFIAEMRQRLVAAQVPVYPTIARAARAIRKVSRYYQRDMRP